MKRCSSCERDLPRDCFWREKKQKDGLQTRCKDCLYEIQRRGHKTSHGRGVRKGQKLRARFGLSQKQYDDLLFQQGGVCRICKQPETVTHSGKVVALSVDHCHETGIIRGLLCKKCNLGIGFMDDDPGRLKSAAEYLLSSQYEQVLPS